MTGEGGSFEQPAFEQPSAAALAEQRFARQLWAATPRTPVTYSLVAINIAVFVATLISGASLMGGGSSEVLLKWGANFGPLTKDGEWWRLGAAMFLHLGVFHVALNMWALWDGGQLTERLYGSLHFTWLYLAAGLAGSLASLAWHGDDTLSVGASGAVFGVYGALLAYALRFKGELPARTLKALAVNAGIMIVVSVGYGFAKSGIDNAAHMGGLVTGLVVGLASARPLEAQRRSAAWWSLPLGCVAAGLLVGGLFSQVGPPLYSYRQQVEAEAALKRFSASEAALVKQVNDILSQTRSTTNAEVARRLRLEALPRWQAAEAELAQLRLSPKAPAAVSLDLMQRYTRERRAWIEAVARYSETGAADAKASIDRLNRELAQTHEDIRLLGQAIARGK